jgi:hypothetical protein
VDDENMMRLSAACGRITPVIDAQCVQAIIDGLRASSDKSRSTRYLYDYAKHSETERPKPPEEMIEWIFATMRENVNDKAILNGFVHDASFQPHHKKPEVSPMQREPKTLGDGGKTAQKTASSATPPLCSICGGNHTMNACRRKGYSDTNTDVSVK